MAEKERVKNRRLTEIIAAQQKEIVELKTKLLTAMKTRKEPIPERRPATRRSNTGTDTAKLLPHKSDSDHKNKRAHSGLSGTSYTKGANGRAVQSLLAVGHRRNGTRNGAQGCKSLVYEKKSIETLLPDNISNSVDTKEIESVLKDALTRVKTGCNDPCAESRYSTLPCCGNRNLVGSSHKVINIQADTLKKSTSEERKLLRTNSPTILNKSKVRQRNVTSASNKVYSSYKKPVVHREKARGGGNKKSENTIKHKC
eukprot:TRINITY_DN7934_c0_g1_i6.p1 TRINITY_DN7934_c0_g1~~TRINITY_DN7934_c0_g1_i6.p1  ORF type:complete len:256 (+),score=26.36 TRINITY_DN7934_c0_g1_i6:463-1230(+)